MKVKVKIRREKSTINAITRRAKKTAKKENFLKPIKIMTEDIRSALRGEIVANIAQSGEQDSKFNHIYTGALLGSVGEKVVDTRKFGTDFQHTIHIGYLTDLPRAALLEQGLVPQAITLEEVLRWMDSKPSFDDKSAFEKFNIGRSIQERLSTKGPHKYPIVEPLWQKHKDKIVSEILETVREIWE